MASSLLKVGLLVAFVHATVEVLSFALYKDILALPAVPTGYYFVLLVLNEGVHGHQNLINFVGGYSGDQRRSRLQNNSRFVAKAERA